jgi:hypothetical protein
LAREPELWPSAWREFIEARDAVATILAMPLTPAQIIAHGPELRWNLRMPSQARKCWLQKWLSLQI